MRDRLSGSEGRPAPDATGDLERALRARVRGDVGFDVGQRALHTMDASNYRRVPLGVVAPRDAEDTAAALAVCREHQVPVVARGGGTSLAGQATGVGVVLDFTRHMNALVELDPLTRTARVQPGLVLDALRAAAAPHGLTFGADPSTHSRCTLGGMIGNNACGAHSVAWGTTADNLETVRVLGPDGLHVELAAAGRAGLDALARRPGREGELFSGVRELVEGNLALLRTGFPTLPRRISGYPLDQLLPEHGSHLARAFAGSEGTLGVVTEATVRLVPAPAATALVVLGYPDEGAAADAVPGLLSLDPLTVEGMDAGLAALASGGAARNLPAGAAWLFVEVGADTPAEAEAVARRLGARAADGTTGRLVVTDPAHQRQLWRVREEAAGTATRRADGAEAWPGWEDTAVPPERLGDYLRAFRALLREHGLNGAPYGHFGEGCIHVRIDFDLLDEAGLRRFRVFSGELADLVVAHGGSLSGEHGDGLGRSELLHRMYRPELIDLFARYKDLWDPRGTLNPGVLVRPQRLDENLRFVAPPGHPVPVAFGYPHDKGDFAAAVRRCVGVAKCRDTAVTTGVMCPSYRVTGEERHSTRGRARLLHEMLGGDLVRDGWRSTEVLEALDLCLACKGCRSDCPVGVDMATYKAEFLHHHYAGRRRPAAHHSMGQLPRWLWAVGTVAPVAAPVLNALARTPVAALAKRAGGLTPERPVPELARDPFTRWFRRTAGQRRRTGPAVVLWPDTFTTYLRPQVGRAAVRVLEAAGLRVVVPPGPVCCGLTWVTTGQLDTARRVMRRTVEVLRPALAAGLPVVALEPSCGAALRTDLTELLGPEGDAARLAASVRTLAGVLEELAPSWEPPRLDRPAVGQTHCHQHAVLGDAAERRLRARAGLAGELVGGCCGLAGNFGFERGHFRTSVACAEEQLLPAVRAAPRDAVVLADGFSCRTQIAQLTGVRARHLAEVLAASLPDGAG
ncbi:dimethylmenaquinone methyltransferase [Wenjunlia vitaminophila]|uniref:Dimethylmenaquinone methyltransferase n=1 Tax=Wenjunlia vitaminophila TaxID=76728 RepID=A0A0T6LV75_WENVI|nr:FAD-binding and (Fe-S)-binding domain-containing protein [Wenjunlia vitaminophila]KRV50051.1 dimethylmenaquinone methyltransferase [Wenjunlia vitaminophila]